MTSVLRVSQLARDLNLSSPEVIDRLKKLGVDVKTASSTVDEDTADKLKRALKIDALASRKRRIYGSEEDEAERDAEAQRLADRIVAERAERERAAKLAKAAAEARKSGNKRTTKVEPPNIGEPVADQALELSHRALAAPPAPTAAGIPVTRAVVPAHPYTGVPRVTHPHPVPAGRGPLTPSAPGPPTPDHATPRRRDIRDLQDLRRMRPSDPAVHAELALWYLEKGQTTRAREHLREAARLAPHLKEQWQSLLDDLDPHALRQVLECL